MSTLVLHIPLLTKDISNSPIYCPLDDREMASVTKKFNKVKPILNTLLKDIKKSTNDFDDFSIKLEPIQNTNSTGIIDYCACVHVSFKAKSQVDFTENKTLYALKDTFAESIRILNEIKDALENNIKSIILNTIVTNKDDSIFCINKRNMDLAYNIYYKWLETEINNIVIDNVLLIIPKIDFLKFKIDGPHEFNVVGKVEKNDRAKGTCKFKGTTDNGKILKGTCIFDIDDDEKHIIDDMWSAEQFETTVKLTLVANQKFVCRERVPCGEYLIRDYEIDPKLDEFATSDLFDS